MRPDDGEAHICAYPARVEWTPDEIKTRRRDRGYSQVSLAEALGVSESAVQKWEKGGPSGRAPSAANQRDLDRLLGDQTAAPVDMSNEELFGEVARLHAEVLRRLASVKPTREPDAEQDKPDLSQQIPGTYRARAKDAPSASATEVPRNLG